MITLKAQKFVGRIPLSTDGMVGLWDDAWLAAQRAVGYAVEALSRTRDVDSFLRVVEPQPALTQLIYGEVFELAGKMVPGKMVPRLREYNRGLSLAERDVMWRWQHDRFASQATTLLGYIGLARDFPRMDASWYNKLHRIYAANPSLSHIVNGAVEAHEIMLRFRDIIIEVDVDGGDTFFANRRLRQLATDIVTNLISNAVKYSLPGGVIRIGFHDMAFTVEDNGVGMDVLFAQRLGQSIRIRERRAEGVDGFGFGWTTIGKALGELGWRYAIETEPNVGSKITVTMNEGHVRNHQQV